MYIGFYFCFCIEIISYFFKACKYVKELAFGYFFRNIKANITDSEKNMPRKYEKSSWGIVYRKNWKKVEILLLKWLNSKWQEILVIPKWHIEPWEVAKDAAIREISEEAGLKVEDLEVIKFVTKLSYTFTAWYLENNPIIDKDVYLFLVRYHGDALPVVEKEERFTWYKWVKMEDIKKLDILFDLASIVYKNKPYFI